MKTGILALAAAATLAACGPTIAERCSTAHGSGTAEYSACVKVAETKILTKTGSAFAKSQRGGPG